MCVSVSLSFSLFFPHFSLSGVRSVTVGLQRRSTTPTTTPFLTRIYPSARFHQLINEIINQSKKLDAVPDICDQRLAPKSHRWCPNKRKATFPRGRYSSVSSSHALRNYERRTRRLAFRHNDAASRDFVFNHRRLEPFNSGNNGHRK